MAKDAKSGRTLSGFWYWLTAGLAVFMVLFYMCCAASPWTPSISSASM